VVMEWIPYSSVVRCWLYLVAKTLGVGPARRCLVTVVYGGAFSRV
jgi:hypothetical protein